MSIVAGPPPSQTRMTPVAFGLRPGRFGPEQVGKRQAE